MLPYPIREQAIKGEIWDYELKAVYVIGILNFALDDVSSSGFRHEVKLMDTTTHEVFFDKLTFVYLEMPKFHKTEQELDTLFDKMDVCAQESGPFDGTSHCPSGTCVQPAV